MNNDENIKDFTKKFDKNKPYDVFGKVLMAWLHRC